MALTTQERPHLGSLADALRSDKSMSELQIRSMLFLMYLAGSETSSALLSTLLWQLGKHPEYHEEIVRDLRGKEGTLFERATTSIALDRLFAESIRLFSPGYVIARQAAHDLICKVSDASGKELCREKISKNQVLMSSTTCAARDPRSFENPEQFCPHRFQDVPKTLPWYPFSDGAHSCPGQWLSKAEVAVLVAELVLRFNIKSSPDHEIGQVGFMTLKPAEEIWLTLSPRENPTKLESAPQQTDELVLGKV